MTALADTVTTLESAVRKEREAIARMLDSEAVTHEERANELEHDYDPREVSDEVADHRSDAELLRRMADRVRARDLFTADTHRTGPIIDIDDDSDLPF